MKRYLWLSATFVVALVAACKKTEVAAPAYTPPDSSYGLIYDKIFKPSCALSGCHADESHATHSHAVTLAGSGAYDGLINGTPKNSQAVTAGLKMVIPNDTTKSFLYQKLIWTRSPYQYGSPMPTGGLTLTTGQIEFVKRWIAAGAPKEGHVVDKTLIQ
ncbi:MAG: hypothetical protein RL757_557 [Bacteroidota bacterium]